MACIISIRTIYALIDICNSLRCVVKRSHRRQLNEISKCIGGDTVDGRASGSLKEKIEDLRFELDELDIKLSHSQYRKRGSVERRNGEPALLPARVLRVKRVYVCTIYMYALYILYSYIVYKLNTHLI